MHPILFRIGSYEVPSYGVALALAFAVGIHVARRRARADGLDEERIVDVGLVILFSSILGARLLWVATHLDHFRGPGASWVDAVNPFQGGSATLTGLSMMGGVSLAALSAVGFLAWKGMPLLRTCDVLAPSVALGEGITRIGCFLNGCCYGFACDHGFCLRFPPGSGAFHTFGDQPVHPTQLYASVTAFALFAALSLLWQRRPFPGTVVFAFLVGLGLQRIGLDTVRYYETGAVLAELGGIRVTVSQGISALLVAAGAAGLAAKGRMRTA